MKDTNMTSKNDCSKFNQEKGLSLKKQEGGISKPITMFLHEEDRIRELFRGLKIADCSRFSQPDEESDAIETAMRDPRVVSDAMTCSHCGASFADRAHQVEHYKGDLHKYNVLRSSRGQPAFSEQEFSKLGFDDDVLSVSGSESETDGEAASDPASATDGAPTRPKRRAGDSEQELRLNQLKRHTKLFLTNASQQMFCLYKCLIMSKWVPTGDTQVELAVKRLARFPQVAVVLLAGGHFAAAVFTGGKPTLHKTFHAYTVRAKQGGSQSSHDNRTSSSARSSGASLRRYNQASLIQHIQTLLSDWESELQRCSLLFVHALGSSSSALFGGRAPPLSRRDPRLRPVPFATRRPTHAEVLRVYTELSTVHVFGTDVDVDPTQVPQSPPKACTPARSGRRPAAADTSAAATQPSPDSGSDGGGRPPPSRRPAAADTSAAATQPSPDSASDGGGRPPPSRRLTARDRRNQERQRHLEEVAELSSSSEEEEGGYQVRQLRGLADLSTFGLEEAFDVSGPLDDPVVTAVEERRRRREFRRQLRQQERGPCSHQPDVETQCEPPPEPEREPETEAAAALRLQCYTLCKTGQAEALVALLTGPASSLLSYKFGPACHSLLHAAARAAQPAVVRVLLERGADPTLRDASNQTAYDLASDKEVRNQFRRFRAQHPNKYDYAKAHIPQPLTPAMEQEQQLRAAQRKKLSNLKRKEKLKERKAQQKIEDEAKKEAQREEEEAKKEAQREEEERQRYLALSDREKRALAAERRLRAQAAQQQPAAPAPVLLRCFSCAVDITGRVPFSYAEYRFCSVVCVRQHRAAASNAPP